MSCWVVPSIAAEYWAVTLDHVMNCVHAGTVPVKLDNGFLFIDVAPHIAGEQPVKCRKDHPPTYRTAIAEQKAEDTAEDDGGEYEAGQLGDWRTTRLRVSLTRRAPVPG